MERVWEDGESEGRAVMVRIGIQDLSRGESWQTSIWCSKRQYAVTVLTMLMEHGPSSARE